MSREKVSVFAPATVANVACAFDVLGFAIDGWGDVISVRKTAQKGVTIKEIISPYGLLPVDPEKNTASVSIKALLEKRNASFGIEVSIEKRMPIGSGLGSSAASSAGGVYAANLLFDSPLTVTELIPFAMEGERVAAGVAHADNVSPSLLGGVTLVRDSKTLDVVKIPFPKDLAVSIVCPLIEVKTEDARKVLKKSVLLRTAVEQFGNIAGLVAGFCTGELDLIGRSLKDAIIEPERAVLIPKFYAVKQAAMDAGALGCGLSGSGPSLFSFCRNDMIAAKVKSAMEQVFQGEGIDTVSTVSGIRLEGCKEIE